MAKHKISVQFAGSGFDRLNNEVDGVNIYPEGGQIEIPKLSGGVKKIDKGNFFHGTTPGGGHVFSVGGAGVGTSPRAKFERAEGKGLEAKIQEKERPQKELNEYIVACKMRESGQVIPPGINDILTAGRRKYGEKSVAALNADLAVLKKRADNDEELIKLKAELAELKKSDKYKKRGEIYPNDTAHAFFTAAKDSGSNSTDNAARLMTAEVDKQIQAILKNNPDDEIELDIQGVSRGAVAATKFARDMNALYQGDNRVSAVMMLSDPVPGGPIGINVNQNSHYDPSNADAHDIDFVNALSSGFGRSVPRPDQVRVNRAERGIIDKLGVAYSLEMKGPYSIGFDPMTVTGADVVIIEKETHGGGYGVNADLRLAADPLSRSTENYNSCAVTVNQKNLRDIPNGVYTEQKDGGGAHIITQVRNNIDIDNFVKSGSCSTKRQNIVGGVAKESLSVHRVEMEQTRVELLTKVGVDVVRSVRRRADELTAAATTAQPQERERRRSSAAPSVDTTASPSRTTAAAAI